MSLVEISAGSGAIVVHCSLHSLVIVNFSSNLSHQIAVWGETKYNLSFTLHEHSCIISNIGLIPGVKS